MSYSFCSHDFKPKPYWWEQTPPPEETPVEMPSRTGVLIIGSGYTGLQCAWQTAAAGRDTLVIDAEAIGWGCSTRNGGQISGEIKPHFNALARRFGPERALAMLSEARRGLDWIGEFIEAQQIDCDFTRCGRFIAAHNPRQFDKLKASVERQPAGLEQPLRVIEPADQAREIDSEYYHGGLVVERHCGLDPAKYHAGLLRLVTAKGARVMGRCRAVSIERNAAGFSVQTSRGRIQARDVVVASNGYTGRVTPWQRRRVIPIGSYMLATAPMEPDLADRLMPQRRVFSDTRRIVVYFRRTTDGRRLVFGGRVSVFESDPVKSLPALRREMLRVFPALDEIEISHTWMGFVAYTFDTLPHIGKQDGIYYAMGYCGSGICLASYLGMRLGQQLLGDPQGATAFDALRFETRPLYTGKPWFLASAVRYYQMLDRLW